MIEGQGKSSIAPTFSKGGYNNEYFNKLYMTKYSSDIIHAGEKLSAKPSTLELTNQNTCRSIHEYTYIFIIAQP